MEQQKTYTLTQEQLQQVLNYLVTRPYSEVFPLAEMIRTVQPNEVVSSQLGKPELVKNEEGKDAKAVN